MEPEKTRIGLMFVIAILVPVAALMIFGWLAQQVWLARSIAFDAVVREDVHRLASPGLTEAMRFASFVGSAQSMVVLTIASVALFLRARWRRPAALLAIAMAGELALEISLKFAFHRVRPEPFFGHLPHSYSFPSGHALASVCFWATLAAIISSRTSRRLARLCLWTVAVLLIAMIGLSRIYLGVHYPSDVVAGYAAATVWVSGLRLVYRVSAKS